MSAVTTTLRLHEQPGQPEGGTIAATARIHDSPAIRYLLWVFLVFLIIEGALRKWVLPGLATPLLLVRDPILICIYALAIAQRGFPSHPLVALSQILGIITLVLSPLAEVFDPRVALYGWRTNFLFIPLIFLIPQYLSRQDVVLMGKWLTYSLIPMTFLLVRQFQSPPDAYINLGVGGAEGFKTAMEKVRASGTFSFVNGTVCYLGLVGSFVCHGLMERNGIPRSLALFAVPFLALSVAVSGSRSAIMVIGQIMTGLLILSFLYTGGQSKVLRLLFAVIIFTFGLQFVPVFKEGLTVHQARFEAVSEAGENSFQRLLNTVSVPGHIMQEAPFLGKGLGMGTNMAASLLIGQRGFLLAEEEWSRIVLESGIILGWAFIALRVALTLTVFAKSITAYRFGDSLSALIFFSTSLILLNGQWGQPTAQGFAVFCAGLALAAAGKSPFIENGAVKSAANLPTRPQGRGVHSVSNRLKPLRPGGE